MAITISALPITPPANTAPAVNDSAATGESLPGAFAALFSGQLNLLGAAGLQEGGAKGADEKASSPQLGDDGEALSDSSLAFIIAPHIALTPAPVTPGNASDEGKLGFDLNEGRGGSPLGLLGKEQVAATPLAAARPSTGEATFDFSEFKPQTETSTANIAANLSTPTAMTSQLPASSSNATQTATVEVPTPLRDAQWPQSFSEKIVWMAKNDQQSAQINLNPPQLGPVQVNIHLNGDQANAVFSSPNAEVRQAIQESLPQLKEMFAAAGINLGQTDIGANLAQQNRETPFQSANGQRSTNENAILAGNGNMADSTVSTPIQRGRGMVDLFA